MIWQDTVYAFRTMRKNPVFAVTAVFILALGIGGNAAMFSVIRVVLLKPLDYPDPDRVVQIPGGATPARFDEMKAGARSFTELGAYTTLETLTLSGGAEPEVLKGARVSDGFLRILGVHPILGRSFSPEEDSSGGGSVVMISAELWQRSLGGDSHVVGRTITLSASPYTVIGVLPPRFQFPYPSVDVWMTGPKDLPGLPLKFRALSPFLTIFGRLRARVSIEQASAEMVVMRRQYAMAHPTMLDAKSRTPERVTPLKEAVVTDVRLMLWVLFGAVGFVLLIAAANVAGLLLARTTSRAREFAVRSALGASRGRLIGQLLAESLLLSFAGGALGVLFAYRSLRWIMQLPASSLPRAGEIHLDGVVLAFGAMVSIGTGVLFGLVPSLGASRPDLISVLRASGTAAGKGVRKRVLLGFSAQGLLVVGQVALSIVLLIGAALLMESISRLRGSSPGFNAAHLLTLRISLPLSRYDSDQKKTAFFEEVRRRLELSPGVHGAAATMTLPMTGYAGTPVQDAKQPPLRLNERPIVTFMIVTPGYFQALEIPWRAGRDFSARDKDDSQRVAIIDENLARRFWPASQNPVGEHVLIGSSPLPVEIVGIAANVHQNLENSAWPETLYVPFAQRPQASAMVALRTDGDPLRFTRVVREAVLALDRDQPISGVETMEDLVEAEVGQRRLIVTLLGSFAGVALLLALVGIYGVISYSVVQRTQEVGIRRALGAQQGDIFQLVMGQGLGLTLVGVGVGIAGALGLTRVLESLLFRVNAVDPATFGFIAVVFLMVALVAVYVPARRAMRIDPMTALRV